MTSHTLGAGEDPGLLIRAFDWSRTSIGARAAWPHSLRATIDTMLASPLAQVLLWGQDHVMLYNAAYARLIGTRHPCALGSALRDVWPERWARMQPVLASTLAGQAHTTRDASFAIERERGSEEIWLDLFYSPVRDDEGDVGGVLCALVETTERVRGQREIQLAENALATLEGALEGQRQTVLATKRRLADESGFLRDLFEQAPGFIAVMRSPDHVFEVANPSYMRLVGRRDLIGKTVREAVPEAVGQGLIGILDKVYSSGEPYVGKNVKVALQLEPGKPFEQRILDFVYQPIRNSAGAVEGIFVEGMDITDQVTNIDRLRVAQQAGGIGTFEWFPERDEIIVSDEYRRIWGYPRDLPLTPRMIFESVDPRDRKAVGPPRWSGGDNPLAYAEYRITRQDDGEQRWIARRGEVIQQDAPLGPRYVGAVIDITERKRVEDDLRASELRASALFGQASVGMAEFDVDGRCLRVNDAMCRMFACSRAQLMAIGLIDFLHPQDAPLSLAQMLALLESGQPVVIEQNDSCPDGRRLWTSNNVSRIVDEEGHCKTLILVSTDISERREAEARLLELNETLEQRVEREVAARGKAEETLRHMQKMDAIGQLTGGVAHDFNNVLQIISANLQLLQPTLADEPIGRRRIDTAISAVGRGARLSSHLLAFARRQPLRPEVLNLQHRLADMDELLQRTLGESITVETRIPDALWNTLVDPDQLQTVMLNIALNARDAMHGVGTLTIAVDNTHLEQAHLLNEAEVPPGDYLLLTITDTGSGMTPEVAARAFEPFFTTKAEGEGTGLGLSMAYGFVRQSQGFIALCSQVGKGTTVRIYLPRSLEQESVTGAAAPGPLMGGHETILVVEDDPDVAASVIDMLTILGYNILSASNAADALAIVQSDAQIDMLFTDVVMPGPMRSPDMAREAKRLRPELAVLFTSGYTQDAFVNGGRLEPGLQLISKPYRIEELGRQIRRMLPGQPQPATVAPITAPSAVQASAMPMAPEANAQPAIARILVVEDNEDAQFLVCEMLIALGHEAEGASDAIAALELLEQGDFDLLFTDVNLPGMSGVELARKVIAEHPNMKVVFASGYGAGTSKHVEFASVSLPKPYDLEQLESALLQMGIKTS